MGLLQCVEGERGTPRVYLGERMDTDRMLRASIGLL